MEMKVNSLADQLRGIGKRVEDIKKPETPLGSYIVDMGNQVVKRFQDAIAQTNGPNTLLAQSIQPLPVQISDTQITIQITANDYWDFINTGVNGIQRGRNSHYNFKTPLPSRDMVESLKQGMRFKGIAKPASFKTWDSFAFAAGVNVKRYGIEGIGFYDKAISPEFIQKISKELAESFGKSVILGVT
jgi:hypothetical protein